MAYMWTHEHQLVLKKLKEKLVTVPIIKYLD